MHNQTAVLPKLKPFKTEFDDVALQNQRADEKKKNHSKFKSFRMQKTEFKKW